METIIRSIVRIIFSCCQTSMSWDQTRRRMDVLKKTVFEWQMLSWTSWRRLNPVQDGLFRGCSPMEGQKGPLLKIYQGSWNDETWQGYILPKEDPKNIWITWQTSWFLLISAFFHWKSANFAISKSTDIDYILIHSF